MTFSWQSHISSCADRRGIVDTFGTGGEPQDRRPVLRPLERP
jgi:hypothetical protein